MNFSPTFSAEQFKELHNALCELSACNNSCVTASVEHIRTVVLKTAHKQEQAHFNRKMNHYCAMRAALGVSAFWSMYEVEDLEQPHAFEGATTLIYREHWGEKEIKIDLKGNTWAALYVAADAAIKASGDEHHVFIENFTPVSNQPGVLVLETGS
jgi:hypothetical protein